MHHLYVSFFSFRFFSSFSLALNLINILSIHVFRTFRRPFSEVADLVLSVTSETNFLEVLSYVKFLKNGEFSFIAISIISLLPAYFYNSFKNNFYKNLFISFLFLVSLTPTFIFPTLYWLKQNISVDEELMKKQKKKHYFFSYSSKNSPQNVLFVIGESHRFDEFKIFFEKKLFKNLILFKNYISVQHHTTPALKSLLSRKKLFHSGLGFYEKSLLSLFREAGYKTYFFSYLDKEDSSQSDFSTEADIFVNYAKGKRPDDIYVLPFLKELLLKKEKKFIVVKMIGTHFNFEDRYPSGYDFLKPSFKSEKLTPTIENKIALNNTYKNAMAYSVSIIHKMIETVHSSPYSTLMSFSSDHGICIYDNQLYVLPDCKNAFHIPWFLTFNASYKKQIDVEKFNRVRKRKNMPLTAEFVFETIVSLSNIEYPSRQKEFDITTEKILFPQNRKVKSLPVRPTSYDNL